MIDSVKIFICEDSIDGIFTAIYMAWASNYGHANIKIEEKSSQHSCNFTLFSDYILVETDLALAIKVSETIQRKISQEAHEMLCRVALSNHIGKADLIYRFMILGFHIGPSVVNHLSNDIVNMVHKMNRYVGREVHHYLGFVRFSEQYNGILYSIIQPKNNILALITPHFVDRISQETFIIYDKDRSLAALHVPNEPYIITTVNYGDMELFLSSSNKENEYQELWSTFFEKISIKERTNLKLQRNLLPLRYRSQMTEFQK